MKKKVKKLAIGGGLRITPAARPAPVPVKPAPVGGPTPFLDSTVSPRRPPVNPTPVVGGQVRPKPTPTTMLGMTSPPPIPSSGTVPVKTDTGAGKPFSALAGIKKALMKKGGKVKASSASKRADGIAQRGKTKGRMI